jgi:thiamine kinase-like enzyme
LNTRGVHRKTGERKDLQFFLRTYHDDRGVVAHRFMTDLHRQSQTVSGLRVPRSFGYIPDRHVLLIESLPGSSLLDDLEHGVGDMALQLTARALAGFHGCTSNHVKPRTLSLALQDARSTAGLLKHVLPDLGSRLENLLTRMLGLADALPQETPQLVHGDFYYGQVLRSDEQVSLIDFDRTFLGDPVADLGNFAAHVRLLELEGRLTESAGWAERFLSFYESASGGAVDRQRYGFWVALGLFELSVRPFRALQAGWREQIDSVLTECEAVLP